MLIFPSSRDALSPPRGDNLSRLNKSTPIFFFAPETLYLSGYLYLLYFVILYRIMLKFHISYHLRVERYKFYLLIVVRRKFTATNCTVVLDTLLRVSGVKKKNAPLFPYLAKLY